MRNKWSRSGLAWSAVRAAFRCVAGWTFFMLATPAYGSDWQFVLPPAGAEHEHPPLRAIPLSTEKPDDLKEKAEYRGASRRYAQLRYGSPGAARVAVVLD